MKRISFLAAVLLIAACSDSDNNTNSGSGGEIALSQQEAQPESFCNSSSWVGGITELCNGHLVYRDYIYDDYGADRGLVAPPGTLLNLGTRGTSSSATQPASLTPSAGDVNYPAGAENTADLVNLSLSLDGDELVVVFELNTLYEAGQTIAALAIDTDNNPATGGGDWPGLGIRSDGWEVLEFFEIGDPDTNLIHGRLARPAGTSWRVQAVLAQSDGQVMNVAFRGPDEVAGAVPGLSPEQPYFLPDRGGYWEDKQAAALAAGDISVFGAVVNLADMQSGRTQAAEVGPGLHERVYTSAYTLPPGEGVSFEGVPGRHGDTGTPCEQMFHFLGKYQPYAVYIPAAAGPHGVQLQLHGCADTHGSQMNEPGFQARFGDELNRIVVSPLGRGPTGFFSDISERDALDALADVMDNYSVDANSVFISGTSMGGYGAMRLASLYPDRFAGLINWVGHSGNIFNSPLPGNPLPEIFVFPGGGGPSATTGAIGNVIDFLANLRHVPSVHLYSGADYLVPLNTGLAMMSRLAEVEVPNDFYMHPAAEHLTYILLDDWQKEAEFTAGRTLVRNPARVSFRTDASLAYPEYVIAHDRAYWISGIVSRDEGYTDIDLISLGCGLPQPSYVSGNDIGTDPLPWLRQFRHLAEPLATPAENRLQGMVSNLASLTIDADASCLSPGMAYAITSDGPARLLFSDGRELLLSEGLNEGSL